LGTATIALISVCLTVGFLTPYLSIIVCLIELLVLLLGLNAPGIAWVFAILDSAALVLLGPGAYSLDARLFGLRVTVVSPRKERG
jgi:hypothetical protein